MSAFKPNPFAKKSSLPINAAPEVRSFTFDGSLMRHIIRMAVPSGFAAKAMAVRGWKVGNVFPHKGRNYYITASDVTKDDGEDFIEIQAVELGTLYNAAAGASATPVKGIVPRAASAAPAPAAPTINPPKRKLIL